MAKIPTAWSSNTAKYVDVVQYSSAAVTYDSPTTFYSTATAQLNEDGAIPTPWTSATKSPSSWIFNPNYTLPQYAYDNATLPYDNAVQPYDGQVSGQSANSTAPATTWSAV